MNLDGNSLRLGIIFYFNPSWMGGINYIINLVNMLNFIDDEDKPGIILFYSPELKRFTDEIKYPKIEMVEWNFPFFLTGYLRSWLSGRNAFVEKILRKYDLDGIYPIHDFPVRIKSKTRLVSWYADLQHKYYPEFFSKFKILERNSRIKFIIRNSDHLVVSSMAVEEDFRRFFVIKPSLRVHIFHFCSVIDDLSDLSIGDLLKKYKLPQNYFITCNQFYRHKNHRVLLKAISVLNKNGIKVYFAFTGKLPDDNESKYIRELNTIIRENQLQTQIMFLGVLPRREQLLLMKNSMAVIQPTLFEGWSTVIEDAISLKVPVIASNIKVNIEQIGTNGIFFDPDDYKALAEILAKYIERNKAEYFYEDYWQRVKKAAYDFLDVFTS